MSSSQKESPYTLFKSIGLWVLNKPPRTHFDEVLTHRGILSEETGWEAAHRLDYETSGCLLFAQPTIMPDLRAAFKNSDGVRKVYWTGAAAELPATALDRVVSGYIGSRYRGSKKVKFSLERDVFQGYHSVQEVRQRVRKIADSVKQEFFEKSFATCGATVEERAKTLTLFEHAYEVELITGARHQIRAFFEAHHVPLKGDPVYGREATAERLALHAKNFELQKATGHSAVACEAPWYWTEIRKSV